MSEQKEKKYVGNGTQSGEFYVNISLKKSQLEPHYYEYTGEQYVRLTIGKLKEENQWGKTHSVWVNEYKKDTEQASTKAPVSEGDGLPF